MQRDWLDVTGIELTGHFRLIDFVEKFEHGCPYIFGYAITADDVAQLWSQRRIGCQIQDADGAQAHFLILVLANDVEDRFDFARAREQREE